MSSFMMSWKTTFTKEGGKPDIFFSFYVALSARLSVWGSTTSLTDVKNLGTSE